MGNVCCPRRNALRVEVYGSAFMTSQMEMLVRVAMMICPETPREGLVYSPADSYKVIGFKGEAKTCGNYSLHPPATEEAGKVLLWFERGRPSL